MRADEHIDDKAAEGCCVERALMYHHEADPDFREQLRRTFMQECRAEAAARLNAAGEAQARPEPEPQALPGANNRKRVLRLPRIPLAYAGLAAAAVIAIAIGVGNLMPQSLTRGPQQPKLMMKADDEPTPMMFSQNDAAGTEPGTDPGTLSGPIPSARGFGPNTYGLTDTAELAAGGVLDADARQALAGVAQESGGAVEFIEHQAEARITVNRGLAEHVISTIQERLSAQVSQPLSQAGSGQVTVVVRFSSN